MGAPRHMHTMDKIRAHMSASTRKIHPGEGHLGSAEAGLIPVQVQLDVE